MNSPRLTNHRVIELHQFANYNNQIQQQQGVLPLSGLIFSNFNIKQLKTFKKFKNR